MAKKTVIATFVATMMVFCAVSVYTSDSDALTGNSNLSLNTSSAVIYVSGDNSFTFTVNLTNAPSDTSADDITWSLVDIGDGTTLVSFSSTGSVYSGTGSSVTVYAVSTGSVEVKASLDGEEDYYASAVVVVYASETASADVFHYYFKIDSSATTALINSGAITSSQILLPNGYTIQQFNTGFWITVTQDETGLSDADFNALSALSWYLTRNGWNNDIGSSGWIQTLLGLGTYSGSNGTWYYWAQYHATNGGWEFNNTTLGYITSADSSYIGLIFWGSPNSSTMPAWPGYPTAA